MKKTSSKIILVLSIVLISMFLILSLNVILSRNTIEDYVCADSVRESITRTKQGYLGQSNRSLV